MTTRTFKSYGTVTEDAINPQDALVLARPHNDAAHALFQTALLALTSTALADGPVLDFHALTQLRHDPRKRTHLRGTLVSVDGDRIRFEDGEFVEFAEVTSVWFRPVPAQN